MTAPREGQDLPWLPIAIDDAISEYGGAIIKDMVADGVDSENTKRRSDARTALVLAIRRALGVPRETPQQTVTPEVTASLRELVEAMERYQRDADDGEGPPSEHRAMMQRAYAALSGQPLLSGSPAPSEEAVQAARQANLNRDGFPDFRDSVTAHWRNALRAAYAVDFGGSSPKEGNHG